MTDATKILKTLTRQKVSRIREGRRTKTKERKGGGGWEKEAKTEANTNSSEERERDGDDGRQDSQDPEEG